MHLGDDTYTRHLTRKSGNTVTSGNPYLDEPEVADLFAFLLGSNEARRAIIQQVDLRELIMCPVDTDEITSQIERLKQEREQFENERDEISNLKAKLPALEEERTRLKKRIEGTKDELASKRDEIDAADKGVDESRQEQAELNERLENLQNVRSELDDIRYELETERESLEALQREQNDLTEERDEMPDTPAGELDEVESKLTQLRERKQTLESEISDVQSVVQFNEEVLEEPHGDFFANTTESETDADLTEELLPDDTVTCWTCGSEVAPDQIESTVTQLRDLSQQKVSAVNDIETDINDLQQQKRRLTQAQRERERIERRLSTIETEVEESETTIERLQERRNEARERIENLENEVEDLKSDDYNEVLELHKEANQLEYDLGRLESDLEDVISDIDRIESRLAEEERVEAQIEELDDKLTDLRTRIDRIEQEAVEKFNKHMETVLEILDYENLERIWLERVEREVREGRRKVTRSTFELHVVRSTDSGTVYEDTIDHLSESEREVTGLIFALAGYMAHDVYDDLPFILLDSLEAIDSERIALIVEYLNDFASYLIVALLPEDASALHIEYQRLELM